MEPAPLDCAVLDEAALKAIRELDADGTAGLLAQVVAMYLQASPALIAQIEAGLASGDAPGVRMAAHTLKSSSANLGARQLAQLCAALEQAARVGALPDAAAAGAIKQEFAAVRRALERETARPRG